MLDDGLRIDATHTNNELVLTVRGDIDIVSAPSLQSIVLRAVRSGARVVLDLSGVTFMDSSGLHVLVTARRLAGDDASLRLCNPSAMVMRLLHLAGMETLVRTPALTTSW